MVLQREEKNILCNSEKFTQSKDVCFLHLKLKERSSLSN